MKKVFLFASAAVALLATGCSNDLMTDNSAVDNTGKERIILGAGDDQAAFRTRAGFTYTTRIVARYVSDSRDDSDAKVVKTVLNAVADEDSKGYSDVAYASTDYVRYWDDAYGRNSILSVYAVAIPNKDSYVEEDVTKYYIKESDLSGTAAWTTSNADANTISWTVATTQTTTTLEEQDLTYSNNIQQTGKKGVYTWDYSNKAYPTPTYDAEDGMNSSEHTINSAKDGRLYFTQSADDPLTGDPNNGNPGHFDRGQMEFHHALSRIQVNLKTGDGYSSTISLTGNLQLNTVPVSGTLNIKEGTWAASPTTGNVNMAKWATADARTYDAGFKADHTYEAQVLPGYEFTESATTNAMEFVVSGNKYYISNAMLRKALTDKGITEFTMAQEKRYVFNITVAKNKIQNITATLVGWNDVVASNETVDNSHIKFTLDQKGDACTDLHIYRAPVDLGKIYTTDAYLTEKGEAVTAKAGVAYTDKATLSSSSPYTATNWYYDNNQTAYHFRSINTDANTSLAAGDGKTFTMTAGKDYHWGAPMSSVSSIKYNNGYVSNISKAINSATTDTQIKITELHMMSQIVVKLKTTDDASKINLTGASVTITKLAETGTVDMGIGKITPATTYKNLAMTAGADNTFTLLVVPQDLVRGSGKDDYVGITIHTADNNEYYIVEKLSNIIASSVADANMTNQVKDQAIKVWEPGQTYTYTFTLKKTEIKVITATLASWNNIEGANTELDLEK